MIDDDDEEENSGFNIMGLALMAGNYDKRCVGQWCSEDGTKMISTAQVFDGTCPYETAFQHPDYNNGQMVIVEAYDFKDAAQEGHTKWLKVMLEGPLPDILRECLNSHLAVMAAKENAITLVHARKRKH